MISNIDKILDSSIAKPVVKKAARKLKQLQYFMPSEYFLKLTRHESDVLGDMAQILTDEEISDDRKGDEYNNLILLASILAMAEGVYLEDEDMAYEAVRAVTVMCIANHLARKGLVACYYDNFTFGPEGLDKVIMERINE
jgi:hypothetical protein